MSELTNNPQNIIFYIGPSADQWKRPFLYTAPTTNAHGIIGTYGLDGLTDGNPSDGDAFIAITNTAPPAATP